MLASPEVVSMLVPGNVVPGMIADRSAFCSPICTLAAPPDAVFFSRLVVASTVSYTHLTLPTKRIV